MLDVEEIYTRDQREVARAVNLLVSVCYHRAVAAGWHNDAKGNRIKRNIGELVALIHSEVSEALEGYRRNVADDHLPTYKMVTVELADAIIRICNLMGELYFQAEVYEGQTLGRAIVDKLEYNRTRADHKPENRAKEHGKRI